MNIGILTYFSVPNFGAQLQALSTVCFLNNKGHNPILINWYPKSLENYYKSIIPEEQIEMHNVFTQSFLPVTEKCTTEEDIVKVILDNNIQAIFVGSDALLKIMPKRLEQLIKLKHFITGNKKPLVITEDRYVSTPFLGNFYNKLKKKIPMVMFSVSSQDSRYKYLSFFERKILKNELENFSYITVRDEHTKSLVQTFMRKSNLKITPDPVFNFNNNTSFLSLPSKNEIMKKFNLPERYVLFSFRSGKFHITNKFAKNIAEELDKRNLQLIAFPHPDGVQDFGLKKIISIPLFPIDWYCIIKYSSGYIGERMHPIVVCLHNKIPFVVFDEYGNNSKTQNSSKIYHILNKANLIKFRFGTEDDYSDPDKIVDMLINFEVNKEKEFLSNQIIEYTTEMNNIIDIITTKEVIDE